MAETRENVKKENRKARRQGKSSISDVARLAGADERITPCTCRA